MIFVARNCLSDSGHYNQRSVMSTPQQTLVIRRANVEDGARIHDLVQQCPPLEVNTAYAYALLATHFGSTTAVAENGDGLAGFAAGYRLPEATDTLFIWQIGVHERGRGLGLGQALLMELIGRDDPVPVRYLEATVSPSNTASRRLFRGLAERLGVPCEERAYFEPEHFGGGEHEPEALFRVGPLR